MQEQVTAMLSHEMRTPISAILTHIDTLRDWLQEKRDQ
jgi:signal transduction histidine kinase